LITTPSFHLINEWFTKYYGKKIDDKMHKLVSSYVQSHKYESNGKSLLEY